MPIRLSVAVMTHRDRRHSALQLVRSQPAAAIEVVEDPRPDGPPAAVRTAYRAWTAMPPGSTHHLVLQDDVEAVAGLDQHVLAAIAQVPDAALCLFTEWASKTAHAGRMAALQGFGLVEVVDRLHTAQGVLLPAALVHAFTEHLERCGALAADAVADADVLFEFLRGRGRPVYLTVPNLVEHLELPSLLGNDLLRGPRRSPCFRADLPPQQWTVQPAGHPAVVPQMATDGRSYCHLRTPDGWTTQDSVEWLRLRGHSTVALIARFRAQFAALPDGDAALASMAEALVFQVWVTAFASGQVLRDAGGDAAAFEARLADPMVELAWSTLVPGALRRTLPSEAARSLGRTLGPLLHRALIDGVDPLADARSTDRRTAVPR